MKKGKTSAGRVVMTVIVVILAVSLLTSLIVYSVRLAKGSGILQGNPPLQSDGSGGIGSDGNFGGEDGKDEAPIVQPNGQALLYGTESMSQANAGLWYFNASAQAEFNISPMQTDSKALMVSVADFGGNDFTFLTTPSANSYQEGDYYELEFSLMLTCKGKVTLTASNGYQCDVALEAYVPKKAMIAISKIKAGGEVLKITLPATTPPNATFTVSGIKCTSGPVVDLPMIPLGLYETKGIYDLEFSGDVLMDAEGV